MQSGNSPPYISLLAFFLMWATERRWAVPGVHVLACDWLEKRGDIAVLRCFRGFGKSTILAIYNAWRYYLDPTYRILHQGDQDGTAHKTARDTKAVLEKHPLTRDKFGKVRGEISFWWVPGSEDERNPSMQAAGIMSNITSSRADEVQNDDVEVPKNIQTQEAREKLRYRLSEQTHILVPGGRLLWCGTPHTHDSLYDEQEKMGADCLTIKMFRDEFRVESATDATYRVPFKPDMVFSGIGQATKLLAEGVDYTYSNGLVTLRNPSGALVDFYAGGAWPERFTPQEMVKRRRKTRTINEFDSQYQLHSKPTHDVRLNPDRIVPYDCEPVIRQSNGRTLMLLGDVQIVGAVLRWDPSSGKLGSDVSAVCVMLQDEMGRRYLHRIERLLGDLVEFAPDGKTIIGGQVVGLCELVDRFQLPRITVETNGIGKFSPKVVKAALKQRGLICGVTEVTAVQNKNRRILEALEPLLLSHDQIWAHVSVLDGPLPKQMRDWNPAVKEQPDDYLDVTAGAVSEQPERVGGTTNRIMSQPDRDDWRPNAGVYEVVMN